MVDILQIKSWLILPILIASLTHQAHSILQSNPSGQSNRFIKVPLIRTISPNHGTSGQPVISYYAPIHIGTPPKVFNIQFDVGLSDSFVPHYTWSPFKINLHYSNGFQCKVSSTCKKTDQSYVVEYQNCKLTGKPYDDVITLSSAYVSTNQSFVSLRQNFLAISDASTNVFKDLPVDGFFGLSPLARSATGINNLLYTLNMANRIDNLQFSFWFNPVLDSNQGGELILGGQDTARYHGQVYWHHLSQHSHLRWELDLQYVSIGSQLISCVGQKCRAVLSSGVNEVFGPKEDVQKIYGILSTTNSDGLELVDCRRISDLPVINFSIDGIPYSLLPSNYIRKTGTGISESYKNETCYVAIFASSDGSKDWVLGTNFLGAYYTIFDASYKQVGFASLR